MPRHSVTEQIESLKGRNLDLNSGNIGVKKQKTKMKNENDNKNETENESGSIRNLHTKNTVTVRVERKGEVLVVDS